MLASILGLGGESHVQAGDEVLRGWRVVAGRGEAGRELAQGVVGTEVGADSCQTGLLRLLSVDRLWQATEVEENVQGTLGCPAGR